MIKRVLFSFFITILSIPVLSQKHRITGYITDRNTGEALIGASVWSPQTNNANVTNNYGFYQLSFHAGTNLIKVKYLGYDELDAMLEINNDTIINLSLVSNNILKEVLVTGNNHQNFLLSPTMSLHRMQQSQIKSIPSLMGEADVLKAIQMLPGVSMTGEGKSSVSVRGGNPDQTLILLDGVPVYNVNHLFGYLSTFNSDIINSATLYKGGLPSRYGGRLSSVLDVSTKEGNLYEKGGSYSLGTMAARLYLEGPLKEGKSSYALSARRTWLDLPIHISQIMNYSEEINYGFWDMNGKFNWIINNKNRLYLSFYSGKDGYLFKYNGDTWGKEEMDYRFNWQNQTAVLRWNYLFGARMFANTSVYFSRYMQQLKNITNKKTDSFQRSYNDLYDVSLKSDFFFKPSAKQELKFGYHLSAKEFSPEMIVEKVGDSLRTIAKDAFIHSLTAEAYFEDDVTLSERMKMNWGLRTSLYRVGNKTHYSLEPRLSSSFQIDRNLTVNASYARMKQLLHSLISTNLPFPVDLWVSSTEMIEPGTSNLYSVGLFLQQIEKLKFSVEAYYSAMNNILRYREGAEHFKQLGQSWQNYVTQGKGQSYGIELLAEKKGGKLTGWASYTLSWSNRHFEDLNFGQPFPYDYDRRHQFKAMANYQFDQKEKNGKEVSRSLSGSFQYLSGNHITFPTQEYHASSLPFQEFGPNYFSGNDSWFYTRKNILQVNNLKMPPFHHLNLNYQIKTAKSGKTNIWDFSVYNAYNQQNVYNYYKENNKIKQISFFPILPSVTFTRVF